MPLSWNEIKSRAMAFSREWADASNENSQGKPFWIAFFEIFGVTDKRVATFELNVKKHGGEPFAPTRPRAGSLPPEGAPAALGRPGGRWGFVDLFWPGILLVEQKSRGKDLDAAFDQAADYLPGLPENLPLKFFGRNEVESARFPSSSKNRNVTALHGIATSLESLFSLISW